MKFWFPSRVYPVFKCHILTHVAFFHPNLTIKSHIKHTRFNRICSFRTNLQLIPRVCSQTLTPRQRPVRNGQLSEMLSLLINCQKYKKAQTAGAYVYSYSQMGISFISSGIKFSLRGQARFSFGFPFTDFNGTLLPKENWACLAPHIPNIII